MLKHETGIFPDTADRRDLRRMLDALTPRRRVEWLKWCCRQVSTGGVDIRVIETDGTAADVWNGAISLIVGSGLRIRTAGDRLSEMVQGRA